MRIRRSEKVQRRGGKTASSALVKKRRVRVDAATAQRAATAEILRAISKSYSDATPVFEAIVAHAARLCEANFAFVMLHEQGRLRLAARTACTKAFAAYLASGLELDRKTTSGRAALARKPIQVLDFQNERGVVVKPAHLTENVRTILAIPLLRGDTLLGVITLWRHEVRPFSKGQIGLLATFSDEAVIAIENARLFHELQIKNQVLAEALEEQSATAQILRVIARSPLGLQSVLDVVVERAARLCGSDDAIIRLVDGENLRRVAHFGSLIEPANTDVHPIRFEGVGSRAFLERRAIHIEDIVEQFRTGKYLAGRLLQEPIGYRTVLAVPLLRKEEAVGVILIRKMVVQPFTNKQIELLQTFADQAVIAIENARMFGQLEARNRELSELLEQQTATGEVLKIISRSTFDLEPVLQTLIENATRLCAAEQGFIYRREDAGYRLVVAHRAPPGFTRSLKRQLRKAGDGSMVGRVAAQGKPVQVIDAQRDEAWLRALRDLSGLSGIRTLLGVPLLREGVPIGVLVMWRTRVAPFTDKQIELTTTFADQAVIAIENVRLFDTIMDKSRELELANTYKSRFLAAASHDLRQPLHALNLFAAQLRTADSNERDRLAVQIGAAIGSMNELFESLLDMSKLDAGILEPNITQFAAADLLARLETTFAGIAREKGLRLRTVPTSAWVRSDLILLERILLNLVSNAVRYTTSGSVMIGCRRRGTRIQFEVRDSGPGIAEDQKQNIFREFYQVASDASRPRGGLGLGLAIVDRLCMLLDHPVTVQSALGHGSRFCVSVPRARARIAVRAHAAQIEPFVDAIAGKRIVVIDDDVLVLDAMRGILSSWGCEVIAASSVEDTLTRLQGERPDVIISDYRLGEGRTGIDAIEQLRVRIGATTPAFLMTGDTAPGKLREVTHGDYFFLSKPVAPITLRAMLNRLIKPAAADNAHAARAKSRRSKVASPAHPLR